MIGAALAALIGLVAAQMLDHRPEFQFIAGGIGEKSEICAPPHPERIRISDAPVHIEMLSCQVHALQLLVDVFPPQRDLYLPLLARPDLKSNQVVRSSLFKIVSAFKFWLGAVAASKSCIGRDAIGWR